MLLAIAGFFVLCGGGSTKRRGGRREKDHKLDDGQAPSSSLLSDSTAGSIADLLTEGSTPTNKAVSRAVTVGSTGPRGGGHGLLGRFLSKAKDFFKYIGLAGAFGAFIHIGYTIYNFFNRQWEAANFPPLPFAGGGRPTTLLGGPAGPGGPAVPGHFTSQHRPGVQPLQGLGAGPVPTAGGKVYSD